MLSGPRQKVVYLVGAEEVEVRNDPIPEPRCGELVVRIEAATTCGTDLKVWKRGGHPRMLRPPCPFGHELAGVVGAAGGQSGPWKEGDRVVVANSASCGRCAACREGRENLCENLQYLNGAFAEYLLVPNRFVRRSVHRVPKDLDSEVAALAEPLACVLHGIGRARIQRPEEVVVVGAGAIGLMFVVELAYRGIRVVLGDPIVERLELGKKSGADSVVELKCDERDGARLRAACSDRRGSGLVIEATGVPGGWETAMGTVQAGGAVVLFGGCVPGTQLDLDTHWLHYSEIMVMGSYHHRPATVAAAMDRLAESTEAYRELVSEQRPLGELGVALLRMAERKILKAAIRPGSCVPSAD